MTLIYPTDRSIFWGVEVGGAIAYTGIDAIGVATSVDPTLLIIQADNENEFLGLVAGAGGSYNPLPVMGEWCEGGMIYGYDDGLVICRRDHTRTEHAPETIPDLFITYREEGGTLEWIPNESVIIGDHRIYEEIEYSCIQSHVTQIDWTPPATIGVLWGVVQVGNEWAAGVDYDILPVPDVVTYEGPEYECIQPHTSQVGWEPPNVPALWLPL